ncbi:MAG: metalloregulator ArsR/SmtB family transcription factor [Polyangiaceae bacterium]
MKGTDLKLLAKAFQALGNPNRLQLFLNLLEESRLDLAKGRVHDCFLVKLLDNLNIGAPTVSHHIKELENAGLIETSREGKQLICTIRPDTLKLLSSVLQPGSLPGADGVLGALR